MKKLILIALLCILLVSGCAFIGSPKAALDGKYYGQTAHDIKLIRGERRNVTLGVNYLPILGMVDFPFAIVLDTALLPFTLFNNVFPTFWDKT